MTADLKEAYTFGDDAHDPEQSAPFPPNHPPKNQWPSAHPEFRSTMYEYYNSIMIFSRKLLQIIALALHMPETYFDHTVTFPMTGIRILHYPPQSTPSGKDLGLGAHTDYDLFTLVMQNAVPALEVLNANGKWISAPPLPHTFVVNIGDFLQRITNGAFKSTVHRVVNTSGKERYSMPFFFSPDESATLRTVESCVGVGEAEEEVNAGAYYRERLLAARYQHPAAVAAREQAKREKEGRVAVEAEG